MSLRRWLPALPSTFLLGLLAVVVTPLYAEESAKWPTKAEESEARLKRDIFFLASPECEGRGPTTEGLKKAGAYIANEFKKAGLKPGNPDGTYFQNFTINGAVQEGPASLVLKGPGGKEIVLKEGIHFHPMGLGGAGTITDVPVVFAGYGITSKTPAYNDYADLDVDGKVVIVLRDIPRATNTALNPQRGGNPLRNSAAFTRKLTNAADHKAAAVLIVNDADTARAGDDLVDFNFTAVGGAVRSGETRLPAMHVKRRILEQLLQSGAGLDLATVEADIDRDMAPRSAALKGWTVNLEVKMKRDKLPLRNVIGVLEGKGPLANETVFVGAHYDHLGYGGAGGSLAAVKKPTIHYGADDNGSGSTAVIELARRFGAMPNREGRTMVFMTFSGEELGLLGSDYYSKNPLFPVKDTAFMLNLDMVGRLRPNPDTQRDQLFAEGLGTGKDFEKLIDEFNSKYGFHLKKTAAAIPYSDHASFNRVKVPVLFFWTSYHEDYHRPSDTADKINVPGMRRIVDLSEDVLTYFGTVKERPVWQEVKLSGPVRPSGGPTLGFVPEFGGDDGVGVAEVREGAPGAKAGLKADDKIVEIAGKPVKNLETYTQIMAEQKKGETIEVIVVRAGKKVSLKAKLE